MTGKQDRPVNKLFMERLPNNQKFILHCHPTGKTLPYDQWGVPALKVFVSMALMFIKDSPG